MKIYVLKFIYVSIKLICFTVCLLFNSIILTAQDECEDHCTCISYCSNSGTYTNSGIFVTTSTYENYGDFNNNGYFENSGNLSNYVTFNNYGDINNVNYILNTGTFNNYRTIYCPGTFYNTGYFINYNSISSFGIYYGSGTFINRGLLSPGNSAGILNLDEDVLIFESISEQDNPKYLAEIAISSNDLIITSGQVTLSGELEVVLIEEKIPGLGESFTLMTYGSRSGTFDNVILPEGYNWSLDYGDTEVTLIMNSIVPVQLVSFVGKSESDHIQLEWVTSSEVNNDYFAIERSKDGKYFSSIGKVNGHGTTNQKESYNFIDRSPMSGDNYYRLKQVDYNGDLNNSKTITIKNIRTNTYNIYPNPVVDGVVRIESLSKDYETSGVFLYNQLGEKVFESEVENDGKIDVGDLTPGLYILTIEGKYTQVEKIMIE